MSATAWCAALVAFGGPATAAPTPQARPSAPSVNEDQGGRFQDEEYRFDLKVPTGWEVRRAEKPDSFLRVLFVAPDGNSTIAVYGVKASGEISVRKLADLDAELTFLGPRRTERNLGLIPWTPWAVERTYGDQAKSVPALVRSIAGGTFGYLIVVRSRTMDEQAMREIAETFDWHVSMVANWMNWWSGVRQEGILKSIGRWVGMTLAGLVLCGILYLLGRTGAHVRTGIETLRALHRVRLAMAAKHTTAGPKYFELRRGAIRRIAWPALGWGSAYAVLFVILPVKVFVGALSALVVPVLGFFGILFMPFGEYEIEIPIDFS